MPVPGTPVLIAKTQSIIEQCDYDLANQFIQRILQRSPKNAEAREMLGVVQLETGLVREAREVRPNYFSPSYSFSELEVLSLRLSNL
jgi:thioredoxin-like negative regulator of GroEL